MISIAMLLNDPSYACDPAFETGACYSDVFRSTQYSSVYVDC